MKESVHDIDQGACQTSPEILNPYDWGANTFFSFKTGAKSDQYGDQRKGQPV